MNGVHQDQALTAQSAPPRPGSGPSSGGPSASGVWHTPLRLVLLAGLVFADPTALRHAGAQNAGQPMTEPGKEAKGTQPPPAPSARPTRPARLNRPQPGAPAVATSTQPKPAAPAGSPPVAQPVVTQPPPGAHSPSAPPIPPTAAPGVQPAPGSAPGVAPGGTIVAPSNPADGPVTGELTDQFLKIGPFAQPVDVRLLVDLVASALNIQVMDTGLALADKKVALITQIQVPREKLLDFLNLLLEQNGQMISRDVTAGIFTIRPVTEFTSPVGRDPFSTTRIIPTPGIRPSTLQNAINIATRPSTTAPGGAQGQVPVAFLDDLGVLVVTDTPRRLAQIESLVEALVKEQLSMSYQRLPLRYVAASSARTRVLELLGIQQQRTAPATGAIDPNTGQPIGQNPQQPAQSTVGGSLSSLPSRLTVDPTSNDLLLRGSPDELQLIKTTLALIDVPNQLTGEWYPVGGAASMIANQGRDQGLGQVITLQATQQGINPQTGQPIFDPRMLTATSTDTVQGGARFVLDPDGRGFMYFGTPEQQARLKQFIQGMAVLLESDEVVYEFYRLRHAKAEVVGEIIRGLINNQVPQGDTGSALLPGGGNNRMGQRTPRLPRVPGLEPLAPQTPSATGSATEASAIEASDSVFVLPYKENNTVVVKAPRRLQPQFARLIDRLDQRRPQVYIDAKIVVVTGSDDMRLAVETQLINASGKGGVLRTLFPPSPTVTGTVTGNITVPPAVVPLTGFTAAIINSDMVPVVITAIQTSTDARIVASPKILVDDNEEAKILSKEERPTTTQSQGTSTTLTGFAGYEQAGPELTVTPQISSGDYLRLKYAFNLSSFVGDGSPPPRQTNEISSDSVTIPSDSTIVVGGLTFDQTRKTRIGVPVLMDIPFLGAAFRDERDVTSSSTIYVFITPRIMRDEKFDDLRLLSKGPMSAVGEKDPLPDPRPTRIEIQPLVPPLPSESGAAPSPTLPPPEGTRVDMNDTHDPS